MAVLVRNSADTAQHKPKAISLAKLEEAWQGLAASTLKGLRVEGMVRQEHAPDLTKVDITKYKVGGCSSTWQKADQSASA